MDDKEKMTIGDGLKVVATLLAVVGLIGSIVVSQQAAQDYWRKNESVQIFFLGLVVTAVACLILYSIGELVGNSIKIKDYTYKQYKIEQEILTRLKSREEDVQQEGTEEDVQQEGIGEDVQVNSEEKENDFWTCPQCGAKNSKTESACKNGDYFRGW